MERLFTAQQVLESWNKSCKAIDDVDQEAKDIVREALELKIAEEQGLLLRLPCKIGDVAWAIRHYKGVTYAQKGFVNEMFFTKEMKLCIVVKNIARGEFGKTVFLTKEEAEQQMGE